MKILEEMQSVQEQFEGSSLWLRAPNGARSRLSKALWLQVRTPSFKQWFGEWETIEYSKSSRSTQGEPGSQVLDDHGEPLLLLHSTHQNFEQFENQKGGDTGFHFGSIEHAHMRTVSRLNGAQVIPVFLYAARIKRTKGPGSWGRRHSASVRRGGDAARYLNRFGYSDYRVEHCKVVGGADAPHRLAHAITVWQRRAGSRANARSNRRRVCGVRLF